MDYKLTTKENDVEYIMPAGSAFVKTCMPSGKAIGIIGAGKAEKSDKFPGFEICVNGGAYYFAGKFTAEKAKANDEPIKAEKKTVKKK